MTGKRIKRVTQNGNGKKDSNGKVSKETWLEIKNRFAGENVSLKFLSDEYEVPYSAILKRSKNNDWHGYRERFEIRQANQMMRRFINQGMPPDKLISLIVAGALETKKLHNIKVEGKKEVLTKDGDVIELNAIIDNTIEAVDNDNTRRYREMITKMCNMVIDPRVDGPEDPQDIEDRVNIYIPDNGRKETEE